MCGGDPHVGRSVALRGCVLGTPLDAPTVTLESHYGKTRSRDSSPTYAVNAADAPVCPDPRGLRLEARCCSNAFSRAIPA
jgi:hypothetical protein